MKIDIITGSRAEYGIMRNLIKEMSKDDEIDIRIVVTGMHLEEKYGMTINDIINDGHLVEYKVQSKMEGTSSINTLDSIEATFRGFKNLYTSIEKPDAVVILGDRYEIFAAASVCAFLLIPIIHIHGGEKTEGNYDEFIRHSITKLSTLHFTASDEFRNRVIQLGEQPFNVHNVGALGVENVLSSSLIGAPQLSDKYNINLEKGKYFVVAFHPETLSEDKLYNSNLLKALLSFKDRYKFILIGANSDTGSDIVMKNVENFINEVGDKGSKLLLSVPTLYYHSLIANSAMLIGNSSSGLIEVPALDRPTVNIGDRQKGRLQGNSVFNCKNLEKDIIRSIEDALLFDDKIVNPYQGITPTKSIIEIIKSAKLSVHKKFYDLEVKDEK